MVLKLIHHGGVVLSDGTIIHQHARGLESRSSNRSQTPRMEQCPGIGSQLILCGLQFGHSKLQGLYANLVKVSKSIGGHGGVISEPPLLVRVHDGGPALETHRKGGFLRFCHLLRRLFGEHYESAAGGTGPSLLRRRDDGIDAEIFHIGPDGSGGDAIEDEEAADVVYGLGGLADVVVGEDHAGGCLDVGGEEDCGAFFRDFFHDIVDGVGGVVHVRAVGVLGGDGLGFEDGVGGGYGVARAAHVEDFGPAEGEPAVADDHHVFVGSELAGYCFHAEGSRTRHDSNFVRIVSSLQQIVKVPHDLLKRFTHQVQRTIGKDDGIFLIFAIVSFRNGWVLKCTSFWRFG
mmetsp:Transcript_17405/g.36462  ORF Transcript_17405/g.36462 Transcript_17405/m.36462 type:complete len:346 (-) Transcript_17405:255-1292(-)